VNRQQRTVLIWAATIVAVMLLVPPFEHVANGGAHINSGYSFIFAPPKGGYSFPATVNVTTLAAQWIGVLIVAALLYWIFKSPPRN